MNPKRRKVAVVFWRLGPYHHARLKALGQHMEVVAIESCGMEDTNSWEKIEGAESFSKITLTKRHIRSRHWRRELQRRMFQTLDEVRPSVVAVPGWSLVDSLISLLWCSLNRTPAILMSDSTVLDSTRAFWKEYVKKRLVCLCSSALVAGVRHRDYVEQLGMPADHVTFGYDVVDNDYFVKNVAEIRAAKELVQKCLGLPSNYFVASARFIEKKNLARLFEGYAIYRQAVMSKDKPAHCAGDKPWDLVVLGDGPLRASLIGLRSVLGLDTCIQLPGFKQYPDLPAYYGLAGTFIHASTAEQWGLVVNEAMASGLPVAVSNRCGCVPDLIHQGVNGLSFDPYSVHDIANVMLRLSSMSLAQRLQFGAESVNIIANWGPARFVSGLKLAVAKALQVGPKRARPVDRLLLRTLILCGRST